MEIKEIPTPTMPDWLKLYNTYDPEYYAPGKRVSAEEWNTLFLASVRQGNYNADTLELLIKTYLPETYLTQVDFNQFSNEMRTAYSTFTNNIQEGFIAHKTQVQAQYDTFTTQVQEDFTALTSEVNSLEERVVKAEDVAYSLNDVIQEANEYAQLANQTAIESNTFAQEAKDNASTALETANNAASTAASSNNTAQDALSTAQSAVTTANNAATQATQAVNTANAASLRAEDAIATANAAKAESAAAKNTAAQAEITANASNTTAESANDIASEAKRIAQNALDLVTEGQGSQVIVNGVTVDTFNADTKADLDYVDRQIAALIGAAPETLDTLEEVAKAIKENETVVDALNAAIGTKANKADIEPTIQFAEAERQKSKNLFYIENTQNTTTITSYSDYVVLNGTPSSTTEYPYKSSTLPTGMKFEQGKKYTFSRQLMSGTGNNNFSIGLALQDANGNGVLEVLIPNGQDSISFTINTNNISKYSCYINFNGTTTFVNAYYGLQIEEGSVATEYQPYNGAIVHEKQLTEQLSNYLPLSGGTMTGALYFDNNKFIKGYTTASTLRNLIGVNSSSDIELGDTGANITVKAASAFRPASNNATGLGTSELQWKEIHGTTIYQDGKQVANAENLSAVTDATLSSDSKTLTITKRDGTSFDFKGGSDITSIDGLAGGNLTSNISVNNKAKMTTEGYVVGTWLQATNTSDIGNSNWSDVWVNHNGWLYKRNKSDFINDLGFNNYVPITRTINDKALSSNISLSNKDVGALPDYTLTISHQTAGNPRMVKFVSVNYASKATCFKMGAMTCHDNGSSYQFLTDMLIAVTTGGVVTANIYKFTQTSIGSVDGVARYTGDVFYVNDTTNKIVDFYILCGQYSASQFTPVTKVGSTTIAYVTQYSGNANYYSSGDKVWVNGCGTTYARLSDLSNYLPLSGGTIKGTSGDTPFTVQSASTSTYIEFKNSSGSVLGYLGVNNNKRPVFYDSTDRELALKSDIPTFTLNGTTLEITL